MSGCVPPGPTEPPGGGGGNLDPVSEPTEFHRGRHLLFAVLSLLVLSGVTFHHWKWELEKFLGAEWPWDGADLLLFRTTPLLAVLVPAWLAFAVFDTRSEVELVGRSWWKIGWKPAAVFIVMISWYISVPFYVPREVIADVALRYISLVYDDLTGIEWSWLVPSVVFAALTEEIVFRALLQRGLEGYVRERYAVFFQAVLFELLHMVVYGLDSPVGIHFVMGWVFGMAFARTRSLMAPVLLHSAANLIHAAVFATALR